MQLNDKINRKYIRVTDVNIQKNRISYSIFDIENKVIESNFIQTSNLLNLLVTSGLTEQIIYELIKDNFIDYTLESDNQNWLSHYKTKRFTIPNSLIVTAVKEDNEFKVAIDKIVADSKIDTEILIIETSNNTIVYANSVDSSIEGIVMQYILSEMITVEDKIV